MIGHDADAEHLLEREYGIRGTLSRLGGENTNLLVRAADGRKFVLKLFSETHATHASADLVALEDAMTSHIAASGQGPAVPVIVRPRDGRVPATGARLITFVDGTPWRHAAPRGRALREHLGRTLAHMDLALASLSHAAARRTHVWDLTAAGQHRAKVTLIESPDRRRRAEWLFHLWAALAQPRFDELPRSIIHADANEDNVLVSGERVVGLIDFGDALENPTVCELAIGATYAMLDEDDPIDAAADVVAGYDAVRPLSAAECDVLFPLMCGRLAASVAIAAERQRTDPSHPTWFVSRDAAWRAIDAVASLDPAGAGRILMRHRPSSTTAHHPTQAEQIEARRRTIGPSLSVSYVRPLSMERATGQYMIDRRGRPYLDLVNNVCHVGHCHPRVVDAVARQMARLNTNTRYLYDELTAYAARLTRTLPAPLEVCYLVNSGSEANELALRLARTHTGRRGVLVVDGAYHGNTSTLIAMSPYKFMGPGGTGAPESWVNVVPIPDGYRGECRGHSRDVGVAYGRDVGRAIANAREPIAAFFVEPILSCGGQIVPPPGYLETAFAEVRAAGAVCVADEVQTGFGRVGSHFWAFQRDAVVPDIVVMGKPIANGHPMGAVVTTRAIAESFANGMEFFSTFGGNPVSCAAATAVLDVIESEQLQSRALALGQRLLDGLTNVQRRRQMIGDVRGAGLFAGIELVRHRSTLEPAADEASALVNRLKDRGMLLSTDGPLHNVIKIKPPLVLNEDDIDMFVRAVDDELAQ